MGRRRSSLPVLLLPLLLLALTLPLPSGGSARRKHKKKREPQQPEITLESCDGEERAAELASYGQVFLDGAIASSRNDLMDAAKGCFAKAGKLHPNDPKGYVGMGNIKAAYGDSEGAHKLFQQALQLSLPGEEGEALLGLGSLEVMVAEKLGEAEVHLRAAIKLLPGSGKAHYLLGLALTYQHKYEDASEQAAVESYRESVRIDPGSSSALGNLGGVLFGLGELDEAVEYFEKAFKLTPGDSGLLKNTANANAKAKNWPRAVELFSELLKREPGDEVAVVRRQHCRQHTCDWSSYDADTRAVRGIVASRLSRGEDPLVTPFDALSMPLSPALLLDVARAEAREVGEKAGAGPFNPRPRLGRYKCRGGEDPAKTKDFREHPVGYIMHHVMRLHDRDKVEVFAYAINPENDSKWRAKTKVGVEHFVDINGMDPRMAAERIREDQIDVLVNLNGYTMSARNGIFMFEPAPVQVLFCGYAASMGAESTHYVVGDPVVTPPPAAGVWDEKLAYMPHSYLPVDHAFTHPAPPTRDANNTAGIPAAAAAAAAGGRGAPHRRGDFGLPSSGFVFCCFNALYKVDPQVFDAWAGALQRSPGSALWLPRASDDVVTYLRAEAAARGVDPSRLVFAEWFPEGEHLHIKSLCDAFVDTPEYNAHVTAADALWSGIPLVTLPGDKMAARVGASAAAAMGLPELVAPSFREYEDALVGLAVMPPAEYAELRARVEGARSASPLFDLSGYVRTLERTWAAMWELHAAGVKPQHVKMAA